MSDSTSDAMGAADDPRRLRRAEKAARKAQKAQDRADKARREALEAVRASGFDVKEREDTTVEADDAESNDGATTTPAGDGAAETLAGAAENASRDTSEKGAPRRVKAGETDSDENNVSTKDSDSKPSGVKDSRNKKPGPGKSTVVDPAEGTGAEASGKGTPTSAAQREKGRGTSRQAPKKEGNPKLASALLAVAAVLAVVAVVSWVGYGSQREAVASEQAETNAPYEAADAARMIVTNMFTYDSEGVDEQLGRVEPQLTGEAAKEFRETTRPQVASLAKETEANSYATVAAVGLEDRIDSDHVVTVVMLNRMVSTKENPEAQSSSTRLRVSVDRVDDGDGKTWKVSKVEVL